MGDLLLGLLLVGLSIVGVGLLDIFMRRPLVTAGLILTSAVLNAAFSELPQPPVGRPDDILFVIVMVAAVGRFLRLGRLTAAQRLLAAIWVLLLLSLARGLFDFGVPAAQEFRSLLKFMAPALYFATLPPRAALLEKIGRLWIWAATALVILVGLRYIGALAGLNLGLLSPTHVSSVYALKAVPGPTSFTIGLAFLTVLAASGGGFKNSRWRRISLLLFGTFTLLLNRRAVYAAVLAGLVILLIRNKAIARRFAAPLAIIAALASIVLLSLPDTTASGGDVAASVANTGTFEGRVEGWADLLKDDPGVIGWLVGRPLGTGFDREIADREVDFNPHSLYVEILLRLGIAGLVCMLALYMIVLKRLRQGPPDELYFLSGTCLLVLLASQVLFFTAWHTAPEHGLILGLGCALSARQPGTGGGASSIRAVAGWNQPTGRRLRSRTG